MVGKSYKRNTTIVCIVVFIVLFGIYLVLHQNTRLISYDNTSMFPMLYDFLNGNLLLKNWVANTCHYAFTDTIWCIPGILFGVHIPTVMSYCAALFHAGFVAVMLYMLLRDEYENGHIKNYVESFLATVIYLMLFAVVPYAGYTIENPFYLYLNLNGHAGTFMFISIEMLLLYLWRSSGYKKKIYPIVFTIYGIMGEMSDNMPLMFFFGPLCIYSAYFLIWPKVEKNIKKDVFLIVDSVFIVIAASLINKLISFMGGMQVVGVSMSLNTPGRVLSNLKLVIIRILTLFGYDTKYGISINPFVIIVCSILMLIVISIAYQILLAVKAKPDRLGLILTIGIISNAIGILCINTQGDISSRYIMSVPFYGTALVIKFVFAFAKRRNIAGKILIVAVLLICSGYMVYNLITVRRIPNYSKDGEAVAEYFAQRDVDVGYGGPWISLVISSYTDFDTLFLPIQWSGGGDGFFHAKTLVNTEWQYYDDIHYLVIQTDENDLYSMHGKRTDFIRIAGEPDEDVVFGSYEVLYYEQDISVYSLSN